MEKAEKGDAKSQFSLAVKYRKGEGIGKNEAEAVKWYRKAALNKFAPAQHNLGECYYLGECGLPEDDAQAVEWYRKAANQNYAYSQFRLGGHYLLGHGVPKNEVEAVKWFRKAAEQGMGAAQNDLGTCYLFGTGVIKDYVEAYKWILLGASTASTGCNDLDKKRANVRILEAHMSPGQIAEGKRRARNFKAHWLGDKIY